MGETIDNSTLEQKIDYLSSLINSLNPQVENELQNQIEAIKVVAELAKNEIQESIPKDIYKKSYRLLKYVHLYNCLMVQEVYVDNNNNIVKYGKVLHRGHSLSNITSGAGRTHYNGWSEVALPSDIEFIEIYGGHNVFYALPKEGNFLYVWGVNSSGCAGSGDTNNIEIPKKIALNFRPKKILSGNSIATGKQTTLILSEEGKVYGAGNNACGELGIGNTINSSTFVESPYLQNIQDISFASNGSNGYALAFDKDGNLWGWGYNISGNLGLNSNVNVNIPTKITFNSKVTAISTSINNTAATSLILLEDKSVRGAGYNTEYQLSTNNTTNSNVFIRTLKASGDDLSHIRSIYASSYRGTCFARDEDNHLWSWGYGGFGLGDSRDGNNSGATICLENVDLIEYDSTSNTRVFAKLKDANSILVFGFNTDSSLGIGNATNTRSFTPLRVPEKLKDFKLYSFSSNANLIAICNDDVYSCGTSVDGSLKTNISTLQSQL